MASSRRVGTNENVSTYGDGTRDYSALSTWESATDYDLVAATQSEILEVYDDSAEYTDSVFMSGAGCNSNYMRIIRPASGVDWPNGTIDEGVSFLGSSGDYVFQIHTEGYSQVQDLRARWGTHNDATYRFVFVTGNTVNNAGLAWHGFIGCVAYGSENSGSGPMVGFAINNSYTQSVFVNCIATGPFDYGYYTDNNGGRFYNCNAIANDVGYYDSALISIRKNCIASHWTTAATSGAWSDVACVSSAIYVDYGNDDYHLSASDTNCIDQGSDLSSGDPAVNFDDDIEGTARTGDWEIGAFNYTASGPTKIKPEQIGLDSMGGLH